MVDIRKLRIKKSTFRFEVHKRYQYVKHYKVKTKSPFQTLMDQFKGSLAPKKAAPGMPKARLSPLVGESTSPPKQGMNLRIIGVAVLFALLVLGGGWFYITSQIAQITSTPPAVVTEKPDFENLVSSGEILTAGDSGTQDYIAGVLVDYDTKNLDNYSVQLSTYDELLPSQVFILSSEKVEASTYPEFLTSLRAQLGREKIIVNEISVRELETIPEGALVIVPTGAVPKELLGVDSVVTMDKLADRGVVIIYIGQSFTRMLSSGSLVVNTPTDVLRSLPMVFDESSPPPSSGGFHLFQPLYRVSGRGSGWSSSTIYDSVSVAKKGDGAFIFLPQTLDGGWRGNYSSAADDVARIITETPWANPTTAPKEYAFNSTALKISKGARYFFTNPFKGNTTTVKLVFTGYSSVSANPVHQILYKRLEKTVFGDLYIIGGTTVISTNITNDPARLSAVLRESVASQPSMNLIIEDSNAHDAQTIPQGNINVQGVRPFDVRVYSDKGEYTVKLVDDAGKIYAQSYMRVVSIDVKLVAISQQKQSIYIFEFYRENEKVPNVGTVVVSVDDGKYGKYTFNNVKSQVEVDVGQYSNNDILPYGNHNFEFIIGSLKTNYPWNYVRPQGIPLEFVIVILVSLAIGAVGILFARPEQVLFSIDIPDFPPIARTRVALAKEVVMSIFEKINETYRWQTTPLTPPEVKNGFKSLYFKGNPIYITDFNVEFLLEDLERRGDVKESMGYYGLTLWEAKAKRSIAYLAMMRKLRDICVNNAVPFTGLGESTVADSEITVVGQQMFLEFFEREGNPRERIAKILSTVKKGITIVLFKNPADKEVFLTQMNSPSIATLLVKMEAEGGSIQLLTTSEFEKMLLEFKSM